MKLKVINEVIPVVISCVGDIVPVQFMGHRYVFTTAFFFFSSLILLTISCYFLFQITFVPSTYLEES